jgi:hypothetical protein
MPLAVPEPAKHPLPLILLVGHFGFCAASDAARGGGEALARLRRHSAAKRNNNSNAGPDKMKRETKDGH